MNNNELTGFEKEEISISKELWDKLCAQYSITCYDQPDIEFEDYLVNLIARGYQNVQGIIEKPAYMHKTQLVKDKVNIYPHYLLY